MKTLHQEPTLDYYSSATSTSAMATTTLPDLIAAIRSDEFAAKIARSGSDYVSLSDRPPVGKALRYYISR